MIVVGFFDFIIVSQRVEDYVVQPLVYGRAAKQNRLVAAIPTAAAVQIVLSEWWSARRLKAGRISSDEGAC